MGKKRGNETSSVPAPPDKRTKTAESTSQSLDSRYPSVTIPGRVPAYYDTFPLPLKSPSIQAHLDAPPVSDDRLMKQVFTHSSTINSKYNGAGNQAQDYERLEFLGDAYIQCMATRLIYSRVSKPAVGKQAFLRETLVKNETLAAFSFRYGFADRLRIGEKLKTSMSAQVREKIAADVFEAYVAAIVLSDVDHGFATAETWLTHLWTPLLLDLEVVSIERNTKDIINRRLQGKNVKLLYKDENNSGTKTTGDQTYTIGLYLTGWGYEDIFLGKGVGRGKTEAGMFAAFDALENNSELLDEIEECKRRSEEARKAGATCVVSQ